MRLPAQTLLQVRLGFNDFSEGVQELQLAPTSLWRGHDIDWWCSPAFQVGAPGSLGGGAVGALQLQLQLLLESTASLPHFCSPRPMNYCASCTAPASHPSQPRTHSPRRHAHPLGTGPREGV